MYLMYTKQKYKVKYLASVDVNENNILRNFHLVNDKECGGYTEQERHWRPEYLGKIYNLV